MYWRRFCWDNFNILFKIASLIIFGNFEKFRETFLFFSRCVHIIVLRKYWGYRRYVTNECRVLLNYNFLSITIPLSNNFTRLRILFSLFSLPKTLNNFLFRYSLFRLQSHLHIIIKIVCKTNNRYCFTTFIWKKKSHLQFFGSPVIIFRIYFIE